MIAHVLAVLGREHIGAAVLVGYGPGRLVTPLADAARIAAPRSGIRVRDILRVEDGRYWSYLCSDLSCCPPEGVPFDPATDPAGKAFAATGRTVLPDRDALAAAIAPVTGPEAEAMAEATRRAERTALKLIICQGPAAMDRPGLAAVHSALRTYQDGGTITAPMRLAWLTISLVRLRIRDDAWARMEPAHRSEHRRLWADVVRHAQPGYIAAPASLLALTAWQEGDGALANIAIDQALADNPAYSMALLLRDAINAGLPPSAAVPPMTPEEVAESYAKQTADDDDSEEVPSGEHGDANDAPDEQDGPADRVPGDAASDSG